MTFANISARERVALHVAICAVLIGVMVLLGGCAPGPSAQPQGSDPTTGMPLLAQPQPVRRVLINDSVPLPLRGQVLRAINAWKFVGARLELVAAGPAEIVIVADPSPANATDERLAVTRNGVIVLRTATMAYFGVDACIVIAH